MKGRYCFNHYRYYIQDNKCDDKYINDLIPMLIPYNFRMKESVNFFLGSMIHQEESFGNPAFGRAGLKLENKKPFRFNWKGFYQKTKI